MLKKIYALISEELLQFNNGLKNCTASSIEEFAPVLNYIFETKGKQIRPVLGILCAKNSGSFNEKQNLFLQSIELIHSATLFHDDIIDNANIRRNKPALQEEFSNKIAVLAGDYFLSAAFKNIYSLENSDINSLVAQCMYDLCEGEIEQNFSLNKILPIEKYLEKTRRKTALLFAFTAEGTAILSENANDKQIKNLKNFGENFGILFQMKDDLKNFEKVEDKPSFNDLENGVITAPIIFLAEEYPETKKLLQEKNYAEIFKLFVGSKSIRKTEKLMQKYKDNAIGSLAPLQENIYKKALIDLLSDF